MQKTCISNSIFKQLIFTLCCLVSALLHNNASAQSCSGTPASGSAVASLNLVCGGASTTLTLSGSASGSGITYQWQSSADSVTWADIAAATAANYFATPTRQTLYRCRITCSASGLSAISTPRLVAYASSCPCTPSYVTSTAKSINRFRLIAAGDSVSDAFTPSASGYLDRTTAINFCTLRQGASYSGTCYYNTTEQYYEDQIWIDFNDNGTFESSESVTPVIGAANCATSLSADGFSLSIPVNAPLGAHRMRVRNAWSNSSCYNSTSMNPCGSSDASKIYFYGNTVDYLVRIVAAPACTGTPAAGTAISANGTVCSGLQLSLSLIGAAATGVTFQWQRSLDSVTWNSITGATSGTYSDTSSFSAYYRCNVTCLSSGGTAF